MKTKYQLLLDTNILLRLLIGDVPHQLQLAKKILTDIENKQNQGLISLLVINELIWILQNFYEKKRTEFIPQIQKILSIKNIKTIEIKKQDLMNILGNCLNSNLDFTDLYLLYFSKLLNSSISSFDLDLLKKAAT